MLSVKGVYENGRVRLEEEIPASGELPVIVTFLESKMRRREESPKMNLNKFSFNKARKILKKYKGSLSEAVIEERRRYV